MLTFCFVCKLIIVIRTSNNLTKISAHRVLSLSYLGTLTINAVWNTTGTTVQPTFPLLTPRSISFDSSGNMYVADVHMCAVIKYPSCGTVYPTVFAGVSNNCSGGIANFNQPEGAFLDSLGNLYVVSITKMKWCTRQIEISNCHK
jgi:hypothetical protein